MGQHHDRTFPGESPNYREARDRLLQAEAELRDQVEAVARLRRELPLGGELKEDYVFDEIDPAAGEIHPTRFSELFTGDRDSLLLYSYMFAEDWEKPCPMCTSFIDSLDASAVHVRERVNAAIVARASAEKLRRWVPSRGWSHLRVLSAARNDYPIDYLSEWESPHGNQQPLLNVFTRRDGKIHHFWASELLFLPAESHRHIDMVWPLWNFFDLTPEGRGTDWYPKVSYG